MASARRVLLVIALVLVPDALVYPRELYVIKGWLYAGTRAWNQLRTL